MKVGFWIFGICAVVYCQRGAHVKKVGLDDVGRIVIKQPGSEMGAMVMPTDIKGLASKAESP